jgi:hypothetical protein
MRRLAFATLLASLFGCSAATDKGQGPGLDPGTDGGGGGGIELDGGGASFDADPAGTLDPEKDNDGDGFLFADDCNDRNPDVNPGAFDVPGDSVDNDCNGTIDDADNCDTASLAYNSTNAMDFAKALGLCRTATAGDRKWGVVSAKLVRANGSGSVNPVQYGILKKFGPNVSPRAGANFAVLSSGTARTPDYPGWEAPLDPSFEDMANEVTPPAGWPKNTAGCPSPTTGKANDSVNLMLTVRVPTNAKAFSFDFNFYSSEYITYVCSPFNDSFVALLDSKAPLDPKYSKNVSFDAKGSPINVNSGFFEVCTPGVSSGGRSFPCAKGTKELQGSGYWDPSLPEEHGATSWLQTKAPVVPGETITIQFIIWDTGDHVLDSSVLLDNWKWDAAATTAPVTDRPK